MSVDQLCPFNDMLENSRRVVPELMDQHLFFDHSDCDTVGYVLPQVCPLQSLIHHRCARLPVM